MILSSLSFSALCHSSAVLLREHGEETGRQSLERAVNRGVGQTTLLQPTHSSSQLTAHDARQQALIAFTRPILHADGDGEAATGAA